MLFDIDNISTFAPWPKDVPEPSPRTFSDLEIEISGGDLLCELALSTASEPSDFSSSKQVAVCPIFISAPVVYAVTLGDVMSQQIIELLNSNAERSGIVFEVEDSKYAKGLLEAESGLQSFVFDKLRHFIIPSDDRWLHVLMDGVPHIELAKNEELSPAAGAPETKQ